MLKNNKLFFFSLSIILIILSNPIFAEQALAGAELPYSTDWYRNPALQRRIAPGKVFKPQISLPLGWIKMLDPKTFPFELFSGKISAELDFDLLSTYIQLTNSFLLIMNPPKSPDEIKISISKQKIQISDESGNPLSIKNIPGQGAFSVKETPLIPPPIFSFHTRGDNVFLGIGLFGGTSGISFSFDENLEELLSLPDIQIEPGDTYSVSAETSARTGIFEYVNLISDTIYWFDILEVELSGRVLFYQTLAEMRGSAMIDIEINDDYAFSEFNTEVQMYYHYPGEGFGFGSRVDFGSYFRLEGLSFGFSLLNILGIEYSRGMKLQKDVFVDSNIFSFSTRPYFLFHCSYLYEENPAVSIIPIFDLGYGKTFFSHAAIAIYSDNLSMKLGVAYEERIKASIGTGIKIDRFLFESGITIQETIFNHALAGIFLSVGLLK